MPDSSERPQNLLSYLLSELVLPDSFWDSSSLMLLFVRLLPFFPFFSPPPLFLAMQHAGYPTTDWTCAFCSGSMGSGSPGKSRLLPFHSPLYFPLVEKKSSKITRKYRLYIANANEVHIKNTVNRHVETCFEMISSLFIYNWTHSQLDHPFGERSLGIFYYNNSGPINFWNYLEISPS